MTCSICHRPITAAESLASGMGATCRDHRQADTQAELFEGLPAAPKPERPMDVIDFDRLTGRTLRVDSVQGVE